MLGLRGVHDLLWSTRWPLASAMVSLARSPLGQPKAMRKRGIRGQSEKGSWALRG